MSQGTIGTKRLSIDKIAYIAILILSMFLLLVVIEKSVINPIQNSGKDFNVLASEIQGLREDNNRLVAAVTNLSFLNNCTVDINSIRNVNIPIDDQGTFQRRSIIQLVCPAIEGVG